MAEHRVPMRGAALRRRGDPRRSLDPQIRGLVAALATLEVAPAPRPDFRAELRAQLVAVTARLVSDGGATAPVSTVARAEADARVKSGFRFAKPLIAVSAVIVAFLVLLGGAVLLSQHALPGDSLYALKRASENTRYGLTSGTLARGELRLEFAGRRIREVASLLPRAGALAAGSGPVADSGQLNTQTDKLVRDTLGAADTDVQSASRLLGESAVRDRSKSPLTALVSWTPGQIAAMNTIIARLPAGSLHSRALSSLDLLALAAQRAAILETEIELGCTCLATSGTDNLGPIPCATGCSATPRPGSPATTASSSPSRSATSTTSSTAPAPPAGTTTPTDPSTSANADAGGNGINPSGPVTSEAPPPTPTTGPDTSSSTPDPPSPTDSVSASSSEPPTPSDPPVSDVPSPLITTGSCSLAVTVDPSGIGMAGC